MTDRSTLIIKHSWSYLIPQSDIAGLMFYERLFELDPALKPLFPDDLEQQIKKLMDMITYMVTNMQNISKVRGDIEALAIRHRHYGTQAHHYKNVGFALIWTLENILEGLWDEETKEAWTSLYDFWAAIMIDASEGSPPH